MDTRDSETTLVARLAQADESALAELFARYRGRLTRLIDVRLDPRARKRVGVDDVLQEAWVAARQRIDQAARIDGTPIFVWLRMIVCQTLVDLERLHLRTEGRSANREVSNYFAATSSASLSRCLLASQTSPIQAAARSETAAALQRQIESMEPNDREILLLRHFEELSNREAAAVLGIKETASSNRYFRALARLRTMLEGAGGDHDK